MRENLSAYADLHAVHAKSSQESAFSFTALLPSGLSAFSFTAFSHKFSQRFSLARTVMAGALVLVLIGGSAGITYAAEDSLPGQPLYAIKVSVAEPIQGALITTTLGKAQWQSDLASRRLAEATTLASQNNLATSTQEYLQNAVQTHVALAEQDANTLAASGNDSEALLVRADLEAKLAQHAGVFALIASKLDSEGDATTTTAVLALLQNVEAEKREVAFSREMTELALAAASSTPAVDLQSSGDLQTSNDVQSSADMNMGLAIASSTAADGLNISASTSVPSIASDDSSASGAGEAQISSALADAMHKDTARHAVELQLLQENAALYGMGVSSSTASSTASTTPRIHAAWIPAHLLTDLSGITNQNLLPKDLQTATSTSNDGSSLGL